MNTSLNISKSIQINAVKNKVWEALTNPEKIKLYLFGTETVSTWKTGSPIIFRGEYQGQHYRDKGMILDIKKEELLKYSYWSGFSGLEDKPENYSYITFTMHFADNKTTLTLNQAGFKDEQSKQHSSENWGQVLEKIKEIVEKE